MKQEPSFESHQYVEQLEDAGLSHEQAYTIVDGQVEMLGRYTISKTDFDVFKAENKAEHNELRQRIDTLDAKVDSGNESLNARIDKLDAKVDSGNESLGAKIDKLDAKVDSGNESLGAKIDAVNNNHIKWFIVPIYVVIAVQFLTSLLK